MIRRHCTKCGTTEYPKYIYKYKKGNYMARFCIICYRDFWKEYYQKRIENKEYVKIRNEKSRQFYKKNRDKILEKCKDYYIKKRNKIREYQRIYRNKKKFEKNILKNENI